MSEPMDNAVDRQPDIASSGVISPMIAAMRAIYEGKGNPMDQTAILKAFFDSKSERVWPTGLLDKSLGDAVKAGFLQNVDGIGWRLTDSGRSELGPMLETDLAFV